MLVFRLVRIVTLVAVTAVLGIAQAASAANFDGVGQHTLTSSNLSFTSPLLGWGWVCTSSVFEVNVASGGATASVTGASFIGCVGVDGMAGVVADVTSSGFPWTVTRTGPGSFTIDGVRLVFTLTGAFSIHLFGSLPGTIDNATHTVTLINAVGLTATATEPNGGPDRTAGMTVSGDLRDDQSSLAIT